MKWAAWGAIVVSVLGGCSGRTVKTPDAAEDVAHPVVDAHDAATDKGLAPDSPEAGVSNDGAADAPDLADAPVDQPTTEPESLRAT